MNKIDIVRAATGFGNTDQRMPFYTGDFQVTFESGDPPIDLATWFGMGAMVQGSFPDIKEIIDDIHEEGEDVILVSHFDGTFANSLDMSAMGMGVIPATGAPVKFPTNKNRFSFEGDKIAHMHNLDTGPEAGFAGFLKAVGAG
jgi:predicted ester cyclase